MKKLTVTGYKAHELGIFQDTHPGVEIIKKALYNQLEIFVQQGLEWIFISGQQGVETWTAEVIWELQENYPELQYAVMTPFLDQEKNWKEPKQEKYQEILQAADFVTSLTNRPYEAPWQFIEKNKWFITHSDALLIVYDDENEGSPKYIKKLAEKYMENHDFELFTIDAYDLQYIAEEIQQAKWDSTFE
ncbi:MAG: DUF1273 domain-containing protein [Kurthia sp.]|nr:DUF1273 domain-containing protein [Candidatus Kurthia equi]